MIALSVTKFEENVTNEDAVKVTPKWIAVSDGAGGGGVFADRWSRYLVEHLPDEPIVDFEGLDAWIEGIWEPFYNECEKQAKQEGGMLLNKFYDEGSFATIVAVWESGEWMSYGDSVAFCYDRNSGKLQYSFGKIADFNSPPYLVNCKDPLNEQGLKVGRFDINKDCIVFATSDTLAHYILMMYEASHKDVFSCELQEGLDAKTKNSNHIHTAINLKRIDFEKDVVCKLLNCKNAWNLKRHLHTLNKKGLIGHDDYSIVIKSL